MDSWGVTFLGIIALTSLVQAGFLIGLALSGRRLARRLDEIQDRFDRQLRPSLEQFARLSRNLAEISDIGVLEARRVDALVADTIDKIEEATDVLRKLVLRPLGPLADIMAFLRGVRKGLEVYRSLGGFESYRRRPARGYESDDEHLFI
jgi:hypothetical protein